MREYFPSQHAMDLKASTLEPKNIGPKSVETSPKFHDSTTVNGIHISVDWDSSYGDYTIYFPQIEVDDHARDRGVSDQVLRLSPLPDVAKYLYEKAVELAETTPDVYELYTKIDALRREFPQQ